MIQPAAEATQYRVIVLGGGLSKEYIDQQIEEAEKVGEILKKTDTEIMFFKPINTKK